MSIKGKKTLARGFAATTAIVAALALAACSSPGTSSSASSAPSCKPSSGKVTLEYWNTVPGMDQVVALWNKQNPNIQVNVKNISNDAYGTINNALKAGNAPELAQIGYDELSNYRLQNAFVDASSCTAAVAAKSDFASWTWSQATFGGQGIYAIPQDTGPEALYYRADLFQKYGLSVPTTWDEYYADAQKLKAADPNLDITYFDPNNAEAFNGYLWQNNAEMYSYTNNKWNVSIQSPQSKQVADYWQKMISQGLVRTDLASFSTPLYASMEKDQVASFVSAAWAYSIVRDNLPDQSGKWAVAPMPTWGSSAASGDWGGSTVAFMKGNKHLYESVKFNLWLNTNPQALSLENSLGGLYPAAKAGLNLPALQQGVPYFGGQKIFDVFKASSSKIDTNFTWGPTQKTVNLSLQDALAKAVNGNGTVYDALGAAQASAVKSMKDQSIPVSSK